MENAKKPNSFVQRFIPCKGDPLSEIVRKIVFIISLITAVVCIILVVVDSFALEKDKQQNDDLRDMVSASADGTFSIADTAVDQVKEEEPKILDKYVELYALNDDIVGWLTVADGEFIDYPVLQSTDNNYYLYRDFYQADSKSGSLFVDWHIPVTAEQRPANTVIYGHNMKSGEYFAKLPYYFPQRYGSIDYYLEFPTVKFDTIWEEGTYKIFAGVLFNTDDAQGEVYSYYQKRSFANEEEFLDFIGNVLDRSQFYTDVDIEYGDEILTLSTCWLGDYDARFVVFARRVRDGESPEVDTSVAYQNTDPYYFDYWYQVFGGKWGGRKWDTSKVKNFDNYDIKTFGFDS